MMKLIKGDKVKVGRMYKRPKYGWAGVTHDAIGTFVKYRGDGDIDCIINFQAYLGWCGLASEMVLAYGEDPSKVNTKDM